MSSVKKILIAAGAAVALCSPTLCSAVVVSGGSTTGLGSFLSRLVAQLPPQQTITVSGGSGSGSGGLIIEVNPSTGNPLAQNVADAALWNLVSAAKSQNRGKPFETLSAGLVTTSTPLVFTPSAAPSPVPLPGVTWLFVLGVLGMAGSRMTTPRGAGQDKQQPQQANCDSRLPAGAVLNA